MTEFTREQKKEFLMQELELTQEVHSLEQQLGEYQVSFNKAAQYIEMVIHDEKGTVSNAAEEQVRKCTDVDEILRLCSLLKMKRNDLNDVQSILRMVRG